MIAEHALNKHSSRSHCIFTIYIEVSAPAVFVGTRMAEDLYTSVFYCISVLSTVYVLFSLSLVSDFSQMSNVLTLKST